MSGVLARLTGPVGGAGVFSVPSRSVDGVGYLVTWAPPFAECACADHGYRRRWCKHIRAVAAEVGLEGIRKEVDAA